MIHDDLWSSLLRLLRPKLLQATATRLGISRPQFIGGLGVCGCAESGGDEGRLEMRAWWSLINGGALNVGISGETQVGEDL